MKPPITRLLTSRQRAEMEQRSVRTFERERERGNGCPYVQLGRRIYYRPEDVEKFIAAHVCGGERSPADLQVGDTAAHLKPRKRLNPSDTLQVGRRGRPRKTAVTEALK